VVLARCSKITTYLCLQFQGLITRITLGFQYVTDNLLK
jgi:hypothetical protein